VQPSSTEDSQGEKVKSRWQPRNGCDGRSMAKIFNNNSSPYPSFTRNSPELLLLKFCHRPTITAISWPPPGFHNFFTLAILCTAARFGRTLSYSLNGCLFVI